VERFELEPCSGTSGFGGNKWRNLGKGRAQELAVLVAKIGKIWVRAVLRN